MKISNQHIININEQQCDQEQKCKVIYQRDVMIVLKLSKRDTSRDKTACLHRVECSTNALYAVSLFPLRLCMHCKGKEKRNEKRTSNLADPFNRCKTSKVYELKKKQ